MVLILAIMGNTHEGRSASSLLQPLFQRPPCHAAKNTGNLFPRFLPICASFLGTFRTRTCFFNNLTHPIQETKMAKTYNSGYSPVVTHLTTNPPVSCLNIAERTGSIVFKILWSYVPGVVYFVFINMIASAASLESVTAEGIIV
jgi:hypothetical protein